MASGPDVAALGVLGDRHRCTSDIKAALPHVHPLWLGCAG